MGGARGVASKVKKGQRKMTRVLVTGRLRATLVLCAGAIATVAATTAARSESEGSTAEEIKLLKEQLRAQREITRRLEKKIDTLAAKSSGVRISVLPTQKADIPPLPVTAGYNNGFFIKDPPGNFQLDVNGLLQARYKYFVTSNTKAFGAIDQASNNFDIFLGRLYFSGNVVDPSIKYWFTLQGTTTGNGSGITLLDGEVSKTFNPFLTIEAGRFWSAYTYEYYVDIGQYLFPDLSAAEWAFSLGRQIGVRGSGQVGKLGYSLSVTNSVPGSDVGATENTKSEVATVLHFNYDILDPYGYKETDPNPAGAPRPELSLWASGMYNQVAYSSVFENDLAGDKTYGATASINYRYGYLTFQGSGYFKGTEANYSVVTPHGAFNSFGWQEQLGYYVIPGTLEVAERVDQVNWGRAQIPFTGGATLQWYAGPGNFPYKTLTEYTGDLNYYFHGNNAKIQAAYSYLPGVGFNGVNFNAHRVVVQTQVAF